MSTFDPKVQMQHCQASYGATFWLAEDFGEVSATHHLANAAFCLLNNAILCVLSGWREPVEALLKKTEDWVIAALADPDDDSYWSASPPLADANKYRVLALCRWLLHDFHDQASFDAMVDGYTKHFSDSSRLTKDAADEHLPDYLVAGAHEKAIELFERAGLRPPKGHHLTDSASVVYLIAQRHLTANYTEQDVKKSLDSLFKANVLEKWLGKGRNITVAVWMKFAFWKPNSSAMDTVLRCYDYMPALGKPEFK